MRWKRRVGWLLLAVILTPGLTISPAGQAAAQRQFVPVFEPGPCPIDLPPDVEIQCGSVRVPEHHAALHAGKNLDMIRLAVAVLPAVESEPPSGALPLVMEAGGPGMSTLTAFLPDLLTNPDLLPLRVGREIVLVEQRGTRYSEPFLACDSLYDVLLRQENSETGSSEMMDPNPIDLLISCRNHWVAQGVDLSAYNSLQNAADIVTVLEALGYEHFDLYGVSYGAMLAQHIMRDYPDRLRVVILDSPVPLAINFIPDVPRNMDRSLRLLFARCEADSNCRQWFPDLETTLLELVERLDARSDTSFELTDPATGSTLCLPLSGTTLARQVFEMMYVTDLLPALPAAMMDMAQGNYDLLADFAAQLLFDPTDAVGMQMSVLCSEDADYSWSDIDQTGVYPQLVRATLSDIRAGCAEWDVPALDDMVDEPVRSDIPTLLLSGEYDPITPPLYAGAIAATLSHATHVNFPAVGHGVLQGGPCPVAVMRAFLDDPSRPPDAVCRNEMRLRFLPSSDSVFVRLAPVTIGPYDIQTVVPARWDEIEPGLYVRLLPEPDQVSLLIQHVPFFDATGFLVGFSSEIAGGADLMVEYSAGSLAWRIYAFADGVVGGRLAVADGDGGVYTVILRAPLAEIDGLVETVLYPALDALVVG